MFQITLRLEDSEKIQTQSKLKKMKRTDHGSDVTILLQVLDNLLLVGRLNTGEALGADGGTGLLTLAEIVELLASVRLAKCLLISVEDANLAADGDGSVLQSNFEVSRS